MNRYQPSAPRATLGVIAGALTIATFGLFVAGPALLIAHNESAESARLAGATVTTTITMDVVHLLPAIDVVARRDDPSDAERIRVVQARRKVQS
jgi:hypothetical protein